MSTCREPDDLALCHDRHPGGGGAVRDAERPDEGAARGYRRDGLRRCAGSEPIVPPAPPPIFERVPLPQRGKLLALLVEDHYVDIVTDKGKTLVLMRLADAIRETAPIAGLQIHRSHWVARDAVVKVHRSEGKLILELSNGLKLPVSRGYLPAAKEAGLTA